jgi:hypothetical protein
VISATLGDDLVAVAEQLDQVGPRRLRQRRRARPGDRAEPVDRPGVDPVGPRTKLCLAEGAQTLRAGKVTNLPGIDDGDRHPGLDQRPVQAALAAARRLQDDQNVIPAVPAQQLREGAVGFRTVGEAPVALARQTIGIPGSPENPKIPR